MICNPTLGQPVRLHYAAKARHARPLHGKVGVVVVASRGKPRNHGVVIDGQMYVIPAGNLQSLAAP